MLILCLVWTTFHFKKPNHTLNTRNYYLHTHLGTKFVLHPQTPSQVAKDQLTMKDKRDEEENEKEGKDENISDACQCDHVDGIHLKPWMDPRALASALQNWSPDEVAALENANFV